LSQQGVVYDRDGMACRDQRWPACTNWRTREGSTRCRGIITGSVGSGWYTLASLVAAGELFSVARSECSWHSAPREWRRARGPAASAVVVGALLVARGASVPTRRGLSNSGRRVKNHIMRPIRTMQAVAPAVACTRVLLVRRKPYDIRSQDYDVWRQGDDRYYGTRGLVHECSVTPQQRYAESFRHWYCRVPRLVTRLRERPVFDETLGKHTRRVR